MKDLKEVKKKVKMKDLKNVISVTRGRKRTTGTPNRASQGNGLEKLKQICLSLQAQDVDIACSYGGGLEQADRVHK